MNLPQTMVTLITFNDKIVGEETYDDPFMAIVAFAKHSSLKRGFPDKETRKLVISHARYALKRSYKEFENNPSADNWDILESHMNVYQDIVKNATIITR